jgi:hypothetical protein
MAHGDRKPNTEKLGICIRHYVKQGVAKFIILLYRLFGMAVKYGLSALRKVKLEDF